MLSICDKAMLASIDAGPYPTAREYIERSVLDPSFGLGANNNFVGPMRQPRNSTNPFDGSL